MGRGEFSRSPRTISRTLCISGYARDATFIVCVTCNRRSHTFCQGTLEEEGVTCQMCLTRTRTKNQAAAVLSKLLKETEAKIAASVARQQQLEVEEQRILTAVARLEYKKVEAMGPMEKKFNKVLTKDVKAFRQTFSSRQLTGSGIKKLLDERNQLVAVFAGTKWETPYKLFLDNYSVYHHLSMSCRPLGTAGLAKLEMVIRNLSIVFALYFRCRLTPKMDILFTIVVPFARKWGNLGIFREERIESLHAKHNINKAVLACIRNAEERLLRSFQKQELKDRYQEFGAPIKKGPRSQEEKTKREQKKMLREHGVALMEVGEEVREEVVQEEAV